MIKPEEKYQAALNEHKHYDSLSLAVVTGMIITAGGAFSVAKDAAIPHSFVFIAAMGVMISLMFLYSSLSNYAGIARKVAANFERANPSSKGFSEVYDDKQLRNAYKQTKGQTYVTVLILGLFLFICLGLAAIYSQYNTLCFMGL